MARTTILDYLDNFRRHSREVAYVHRRGYRTQRWTYGKVLADAHRFARDLDSRSIAKGDKILIWGENCAEWVVAFFGCLLRGVVVVPIDKIAVLLDFAERVAPSKWMPTLCRPRRRIRIPGLPFLALRGRCAITSLCIPIRQSLRRRSLATTSSRSSLPRAQPPSLAAWSILGMATSWPTWNRWNARNRQVLALRACIFHPLRDS